MFCKWFEDDSDTIHLTLKHGLGVIKTGDVGFSGVMDILVNVMVSQGVLFSFLHVGLYCLGIKRDNHGYKHAI